MILQNKNRSFLHHMFVHMIDQRLRWTVDDKKIIVEVWLKIVQDGHVESLFDDGRMMIETDEIDDVGNSWRQWWMCVDVVWIDVVEGLMRER